MKTLTAFKASLELNQPPDGLSEQLKSLWFDAKGDWHKAHVQVDHLNDRQSAWVHAYLHRKEDDIGNAIIGTSKQVKRTLHYLWKRNGSNWLSISSQTNLVRIKTIMS